MRFECRQVLEVYLFSKKSRPALGLPSRLSSEYRPFFIRGKAAVAWGWPLTSWTEIYNSPFYTFMTCIKTTLSEDWNLQHVCQGHESRSSQLLGSWHGTVKCKTHQKTCTLGIACLRVGLTPWSYAVALYCWYATAAESRPSLARLSTTDFVDEKAITGQLSESRIKFVEKESMPTGCIVLNIV